MLALPAEALSFKVKDIQLFVEQQTGCKASLHEDRLATWKNADGDMLTRHVYTFALVGHAKAKRAFVWLIEGTAGTRSPKYEMLLAVPPINSPENALAKARAEILRSL